MPRNLALVLSGAAAAVAAVVILAVTGAAFFDVAADTPHWPVTKSILSIVRERAVANGAAQLGLPPRADAHMIADGAADYDAMCTACHLAPGMAENEMRPGLNPKPPVLWRIRHGDPREEFWVIKHGIKMTGMPAWGVTHSDEEIWNMVAFLQKLPHLTPAQYKAAVASGGDHHDHDHMDMH